VSNVVDKFVTTKEEKAILERELTNVVNDWQNKAQDQLTERQRIDMASDSWLSKNIRPLTLIFILASYTILSISDGNLGYGNWQFSVQNDYVTLLGEWGRAIMYFYFGGRTLEKAVSIFRKKR